MGVYETVIGLEVHIQLLTQSKLFCGDSAGFGAAPNTHVSAITLAHPGTLPKMNSQVIDYAAMLGLSLNCELEQHNYFARKNYFYPDLPKGYQVSQHTTPICKGGTLTIATASGERNILLNRIHMEEDAGKSIHDLDEQYTCIDLNRAGVPLLELVTEPDLHSSDEAFAFLTELRKLVRWLNICDGNMEEGSMRCDANISLRPKGSTTLGTKVEVKNLNSIRNVKTAIDVEVARLTNMLDNGETIQQETRSFDADKTITFSLRSKEEANDYRYFAEPDLTPFHISQEYINSIKATLPILPAAKKIAYEQQFQLSSYDAGFATQDKATSDYFDALTNATTHYKAACNWLMGPVQNYLNEQSVGIEQFPLPAAKITELIELVAANTLSFSTASTKLFNALLAKPTANAASLASEMNLLQVSDSNELDAWVQAVLAKMPDKVAEYKKGKKGLLGLFMGEVKKLSKGKADPKLTTQLLEEKLNA